MNEGSDGFGMTMFPFFIPGTASLVEELDKKLLVVLRDGRKLIGTLRSFDQFANIVLEDTIERVYIDDIYGDIKCGLYLIRGENVVILGEIDAVKEQKQPINLRKVSSDEIMEAQKKEKKLKEAQEKTKRKFLQERGVLLDNSIDDYTQY